jgi:hypothetical protein
MTAGSKRLASALKRLGWSQDGLAKWLKEQTGRPVAQSSVSRYLNGKRSPEIVFVVAMAKRPVLVPAEAWARAG